MKKKVFGPDIEDIYNNLPEAQKKLYLKKYNKQHILSFILLCVPIIMIIAALIRLPNIYEMGLFEELLLVVILLVYSGYVLYDIIAFVKSTDEVKVKRFIENLEKRKEELEKRREDLEKRNSRTELFLDTAFSKLEKQRQTKEKQNLNYEEIKCVNNYVNSFLDNGDLKTICNNYIKNNRLPLNYLELVFVPVVVPDVFDKIGLWLVPASLYKFKYPKNLVLDNSPYIEVLKEFKEETISASDVSLLLATVIRQAGLTQPYETVLKEKSQYDEEVFNNFDKARKMFHTLCNQGVINGEKDIYQYYAFIFMLYYLQKIDAIDMTKQILKDNNISNGLNLKEFIEECYYKGLDEKLIINLTVFTESEKQNNKPLINKLGKELEPIVYSTINSIKEKESIERLRAGDVVHKPKCSMAQIDLMTGAEFEKFVTNLFNCLGWQAENTKLSSDQGVDVIAQKGDKTMAIQAKHYNQSVGNHAIMEVVAGAKYYNATLCCVVTNNYFTKSAKELAAANNVILWDRDKLIEKMSETC